MKAKNLQLTPQEIADAKGTKKGTVTFSPASRNRIICNQAPRLGHLSKKDADVIRSQVWPSASGGGRPKRQLKCKARYQRGNYENNYKGTVSVRCKACGRIHSNVEVNEHFGCPCGRTIVVVP